VSLNIPFDIASSQSDAVNFLNQLTRTYCEWFSNQYYNKKYITNVSGEIDFANIDYPDIVDAFKDRITSIAAWLNEKKNESGDFRSSVTGYSFEDILNHFNLVVSSNLDNLGALVDLNALTKDRQLLLERYQYQIREYELNMNKKLKEAETTEAMIASFDQTKYQLVIPGVSSAELPEGALAEDTSGSYDALVQRATDARVEAENLRLDRAYIETKMAILNESILYDPNNLQIGDISVIDARIASLETTIQEWIRITNDTLSDYYSVRYSDALKIALPPRTTSSLASSMRLYGLAGAAAGLVVGVILGFIVHHFKNSKENKEEDKDKNKDKTEKAPANA
jgi:hypothetical protein